EKSRICRPTATCQPVSGGTRSSPISWCASAGMSAPRGLNSGILCGRARRWPGGLMGSLQRASHSAGSIRGLLNGQGRRVPKKSTHNPFWEIVRNFTIVQTYSLLLGALDTGRLHIQRERKKPQQFPMRRLSEKRQEPLGATHGWRR
ncbi:12368_t:CDS:2, partial [Acaulospora colombiana]